MGHNKVQAHLPVRQPGGISRYPNVRPLLDEELEQLELAKASIDATVEEAMAFVGQLEITLRRGLPQERLVSLRQCVERICINAPDHGARMALRVVPGTQLSTTVDRCISLASPARRT